MMLPINSPLCDQAVTPPLLIVVRSPRWQSQIQRWIQRLDLSVSDHWLLTHQDARAMSLSNPAAAMVVEIPQDFGSDQATTLLNVARLCNNAQNCPLFLLGDAAADSWTPALREAGAVDVCTSVLDFDNFGLRIRRHLENHVQAELTVEQKVSARLPW